jgi:hypothetical protein
MSRNCPKVLILEGFSQSFRFNLVVIGAALLLGYRPWISIDGERL